MKQKLLIAVAATAMMAAPSFASAQDGLNGSGWYLKGGVGYGAHTDVDLTDGLVGDVEAEGNGALNLGLGYDFGDNWRVEVDGTTMYNDHGGIENTPGSFAKFRTDALMLNAIYDFSDFNRWEPYVGAGLGFVRADASLEAHDFPNVDNNGVTSNTSCAGPRTDLNSYSCTFQDQDTGLGWQLLAGLGYAITDNLSWDTSYRYMQVEDLFFDGTFNNDATGASTVRETRAQDLGAHQLITGFRYRFGGTPTPPPPPPVMPEMPKYECWDGSMVFNAGQCPQQVIAEAQPTVSCWDGSLVFDAAECPVQPEVYTCPDGSLTYDQNSCITSTGITTGDLCGEQYRQEIIYYEFDKGASAETRNTISRILDAGQYCDVASIRVVGHTDTSGAASYNLALSKRRATDALNELVRQGIDRSIISSEGKGETEPFVQTGDGVKEQLNRRTEVLISLASVGASLN